MCVGLSNECYTCEPQPKTMKVAIFSIFHVVAAVGILLFICEYGASKCVCVCSCVLVFCWTESVSNVGTI